MNSVNWFEIPCVDYNRAVSFYSKLLGIEIATNQMGPVTFGFFPGSPEGMGSTGAISFGDGNKPSLTGSRVCFYAGEDLAPTLSKVEGLGGKILLPKTSIGDHGYIAHFSDTEGNLVMLHSLK